MTAASYCHLILRLQWPVPLQSSMSSAHSVPRVGFACCRLCRGRRWRGTHIASMRSAATRVAGEALLGSSADVCDSTVLISGGGFAGVGAAMALVQAGVDTLLCEQGRGLGGRVATRRVRDSDLQFDHGCQYFAPKPGTAFETLALDLEAAGVLARWAAGRIGTVSCAADGRFDTATFVPNEAGKTTFVGVPSMSAVGKHLLTTAARQPGAGALTVALGTRVAPGSLRRDGELWTAETHAKNKPDDRVRTRHRYVLALGSASSTFNVVSPVADALAAPAGRVQANACWALMVALASPLTGKTRPPFDGAMVTNSQSLAWVALDSSKPGRSSRAAAECWVVHAGPEWSNARRDVDADAVASELLEAFVHAFGASSPEVLYKEAFKWNAAFPLSVADSAGAGCFVDTQAAVGLAGDWCIGPRAGDAWQSGQMASRALLDSTRQ